MEEQKQIGQLKTSLEEVSERYHAVGVSSSILQPEVETVKQNLSDLSGLAANDGLYVGKIANMTEKLAETTSEGQASI